MGLRTRLFWIMMGAIIVAVIVALLIGADRYVNTFLFFSVIAVGVVGALRGKRL